MSINLFHPKLESRFLFSWNAVLEVLLLIFRQEWFAWNFACCSEFYKRKTEFSVIGLILTADIENLVFRFNFLENLSWNYIYFQCTNFILLSFSFCFRTINYYVAVYVSFYVGDKYWMQIKGMLPCK